MYVVREFRHDQCSVWYLGKCQAVPTILGAAVDGHGRLCMLTRPNSGKVKRIRNNPAVTITACDGQGRPKTPSIVGTANLLDPPETAQVRRILTRRHPAAWLVLLADRLRPRHKRWIGISVSLPSPTPGPA